MFRAHWRKEGIKITNGKRTWLRGDVVKYTKAERGYTGKWIIDGVTEDGKIIIKAYGRPEELMQLQKTVIYLYDDSYLKAQIIASSN